MATAKGRPATMSLPVTTYAILGMVAAARECSGYDLAKGIDSSIGHFMTPAKSQIYAELRRLVGLGYADERSVRQSDRPDKRVYRVTPAGRRALRRWLDTAPLEEDSVRSMLLVKLFFGKHMDRPSLIAQVRDFRDEVVRRQAAFETLERRLKPDPSKVFAYLTVRSGSAHARASLRWADEVIDRLRRRP